jgi:peptide/nickel transport system ATP-binding protein
MNRVLEVYDLNVTYKMQHKQIFAVQNAAFHIEKGDSVGIVGESGSGKSTLAMAVLRLLPRAITEVTGCISFLGADLINMHNDKLRELRWKHLAVVFQKSMNSLSPVHRIGEQIEDIYRVHKPKAGRAEIREKVNDLFDLVNLGNRILRMYPHELSGGMLQRVAIAISLLHNPDLLVLDEATTALDVVTQGQILDEIKKMEETLNLTRMMITHDMSVVAASCNKIVVMYAGEIVEIGLVRNVLPMPKHPYTQGLIASFPSLKGQKSELRAISGTLPDLSEKIVGCVFASRCQFVHKRCLEEKPRNIPLDPHSMVKCHLMEGAMTL